MGIELSSTKPAPASYPFNSSEGLDLDEAYERAQKGEGLQWVRMPYGEPGWLVSRYDDARFVLGDRRFSHAAVAENDAPRMRELQTPSGILGMDAPDHTRLRGLVTRAFTPRRVEARRPHVKELTASLLQDMKAIGSPVDLVEHYAIPIPVAVICGLLGVPNEDRALFRGWCDIAMSTSSLTAEDHVRLAGELMSYLSDLVEDRRAAPQDDLVSALIEARDVNGRLSHEELVNLIVFLLFAGHETTASQISSFVLVLLEQPDQLALLRSRPDLLENAVEELTRFIPLGIGAAFPRYATEDIEVGGTLIRAGEPVLIQSNAASRDALRFPSPGVLDITRDDARHHLGYGHGPHHCLGASLARLELQEALRTLLDGLPGLHLAQDVEWKKETIVRGPRRMFVAW
ncbi:cytochrome P450 [Streptomyces sp. NPDC047117]|uniref:cytochrome P450 n=1 Tax=Streptomyces sp. NPDC047117 TaxID=3155379 RepID=UPI0033C10CF4